MPRALLDAAASTHILGKLLPAPPETLRPKLAAGTSSHTT